MLGQKPSSRRIYDISVLIHPKMAVYPGDPAVAMSQYYSMAQGDPVNLTSLCFGAHMGTHVDAPRHVESTWPSLQDLDLDAFVGPATVFELDVAEAITAQDLGGMRWEGVERVLFKTRNSRLWDGEFHEDFVYLAEDAARFLAQNTGVRLVGFDYLSVEQFAASRLTTHRELLGRGVVVVEGLNLSEVAPGEYDLVCLPLKLAAEDGSPARAILVDCTIMGT